MPAAMSRVQPYYTLSSDMSSIVIDCRGNAPVLLYWGPRLGESTTAEMLASLAIRQKAQARVDVESPVGLSPEYGSGFPGSAGIHAHRDGRHWGTYSRIVSVTTRDPGGLTITSECPATDVRIVCRLDLDSDSNVLVATTEITNTGTTELAVDSVSAPSIPVPLHLNRITGYEGRWSNEFQQHTVDRFLGSYVRENRAGRTSHDSFPGLVLHTAATDESRGDVLGLHLGWSGNHRLRVEEMSDGRAYAQLGELFFPGEMSLAPGESYRTPKLYGVSGEHGFTAMSQCFHSYVRRHLATTRARGTARPVHFNTWEATYFDLSLERLCRLADAAAEVGAERFVLDDGWFRNRRSDNAGLGDWYVDEAVFPEGLGPLTDYVLAQGMEFGLWVEPEMVNTDSDLYRAHPDWVLRADPAPLLMGRNQLVLDLTRREVGEYLFERIDALLSEYPISYLKWDMNRDISQPGGKDGRAVGHHQALACYALIRRIREAHPDVEIESCASGGGRADFGILGLVDRIWTSDNNDPLDRLRIQQGFSCFFPAEFMGAHVGPEQCHISGRHASLDMRAGVALFGHMGIEANLLQFSDTEKRELKSAIELYKRYRGLIFSGDLVRLDMHACENGFGIVSPDRGQALFSYALRQTPPHSAPARYRFRGLDAESLYAIQIVWPLQPRSWSRSILDTIQGAVVSGAALKYAGLQLPILRPESLLIFELRATDRAG